VLEHAIVAMLSLGQEADELVQGRRPGEALAPLMQQQPGGELLEDKRGILASMMTAPPNLSCRYSATQQEYMYHMSLALKNLSASESQRLMVLLGQPTHQACIDALANICEPAAAPQATSAAQGALTGMPPSFSIPNHSLGKTLNPQLADVPPLRLDALGGTGVKVGCSLGSDTFSTRQSNISSQPYSSVHVSPRIVRSSTMTPRGTQDYSQMMPVPTGALTERPSQRARTKKRNSDMEYGSALLDRMQEEQRAVRKRTGAMAFGDGSFTERLVSPRRRKSGPPSSRDKVWDLLREEEKDQILRDVMSAAEGTKALLERRAVQLGCEIVDMPEEDDWDIGFRLTECKATSEPLAKPKNCSICLRCAAPSPLLAYPLPWSNAVAFRPLPLCSPSITLYPQAAQRAVPNTTRMDIDCG
jgi:hypothetical protein